MLEQLDATFDDMSSQIIERSALFAPVFLQYIVHTPFYSDTDLGTRRRA